MFANKVIQKNFLLSTFIQNGLQGFLKSLPNWNKSPSSSFYTSSLPCVYFKILEEPRRI
jgi:hypothetical protein